MHVEGIFEKIKEGFATAAQATQLNISLNARNVASVTMVSLLVDRYQIEFYILNATGLNLRTGIRDQSRPIAVWCGCVSVG